MAHQVGVIRLDVLLRELRDCADFFDGRGTEVRSALHVGATCRAAAEVIEGLQLQLLETEARLHASRLDAWAHKVGNRRQHD